MAAEWNTIGKYLAGSALFGGVYYLVLIDKVPVADFITMVNVAVGALGIGAIRAVPK